LSALDIPEQIAIPELQEVQRIDRAVTVEIERGVVRRDAKQSAAEGEKVGGVNVAVTIRVAEEAVETERVIIAAETVVIPIERPGPTYLIRQHLQLIIAIVQRSELRQRP